MSEEHVYYMPTRREALIRHVGFIEGIQNGILSFMINAFDPSADTETNPALTMDDCLIIMNAGKAIWDSMESCAFILMKQIVEGGEDATN